MMIYFASEAVDIFLLYLAHVQLRQNASSITIVFLSNNIQFYHK